MARSENLRKEDVSLMPFVEGLDFSGDGDNIFNSVFAQIVQTEERRMAKDGQTSAVFSCECMKKSSAYSVALELAPHVRKALDSLGALPEHQDARLQSSCEYVQSLKNLDTTTS